MSLRRTHGRTVATLLVPLLFVGGAAALAADRVNTDRTGLALDGYDPVAYFIRGQPLKGDFEIIAEHDGAIYRFVDESNRERFQQDPERFLPQYGGYCAYGVAVGKKFTADPTVWRIADGRLYLNLSPEIAERFNEDVAGHVERADANWKTIAEAPAR